MLKDSHSYSACQMWLNNVFSDWLSVGSTPADTEMKTQHWNITFLKMNHLSQFLLLPFTVKTCAKTELQLTIMITNSSVTCILWWIVLFREYQTWSKNGIFLEPEDAFKIYPKYSNYKDVKQRKAKNSYTDAAEVLAALSFVIWVNWPFNWRRRWLLPLNSV